VVAAAVAGWHRDLSSAVVVGRNSEEPVLARSSESLQCSAAVVVGAERSHCRSVDHSMDYYIHIRSSLLSEPEAVVVMALLLCAVYPKDLMRMHFPSSGLRYPRHRTSVR